MAKKKKASVGYGVKPPYIHLGGAIDIARRVYEDAGGNVSEDELSSIVGNSVGSSSFKTKLLALKSFGVVNQEGHGQRITLSDLGRRLVAALTPEDRARAQKEAFLRIETYRRLYDLWAGKILPTEEFFLNALREQCKIPQQLTKDWMKSFTDSGNAAGLFQQRPDGKTQVRIESGSVSRPPEIDPSGPSAGESPQGGDDHQTPGAAVQLKPPPPGTMQRFQIPLLEAKLAVVELPHGWTESDIVKMLQIMKVMFLWEKEQ